MERSKFEVHAVDEHGGLLVVASDNREAAEGIAEVFEKDGLANVTVIENKF